jgi:hypothetical protein
MKSLQGVTRRVALRPLHGLGFARRRLTETTYLAALTSGVIVPATTPSGGSYSGSDGMGPR